MIADVGFYSCLRIEYPKNDFVAISLFGPGNGFLHCNLNQKSGKPSGTEAASILLKKWCAFYSNAYPCNIPCSMIYFL